MHFLELLQSEHSTYAFGQQCYQAKLSSFLHNFSGCVYFYDVLA